MAPIAIPLSQLAKRVARKQSELDRLMRRYEIRLTNLKGRKEELEAQLRKVDAEIQAVSQGGAEQPATPVADVVVRRSKGSKRVKLPGFIVSVLQTSAQPLTVKQIADEVKRRKFPTKSKKLAQMVQARVYEMVKKGVLTHADGQQGYVVNSANGRPMTSPAAAPAKRKPGRKARGGGRKAGQPSLKQVLTKLLEGRKEPIGGGELADMALESGYKTTSQSFRDVVWVNLGNMDNVEHIKGKGYRLKR